MCVYLKVKSVTWKKKEKKIVRKKEKRYVQK
jgi:hypothetical protein